MPIERFTIYRIVECDWGVKQIIYLIISFRIVKMIYDLTKLNLNTIFTIFTIDNIFTLLMSALDALLRLVKYYNYLIQVQNHGVKRL